MIYLQTAFDRLMAQANPLPAEPVSLDQAQGRVLAEDVAAPLPVPHFRRAMMDGYAVHTEDLKSVSAEQPVRLRVTNEVAAGEVDASGPARGEAWKIATGAPVPDCADAVVPKEWTRSPDDSHVEITRPPHKSNIAPPGEDVPEGQRILCRGTVLNGTELGLLASVGLASVRVHRRPRVAILVTGSELAETGKPLAPGQVYNSNGIALRSYVREAGGQVVAQDTCPDRDDALHDWIDRALTFDPDVILSSGGVSVGERDLIRAVWRDRGARERFWRIAIKPGKPVYAAALDRPDGPSSEDPIHIIGLSGTPAANTVVFRVLVRPMLLKMGGRRAIMPARRRVRLSDAYPKPADMTRLLWANISGSSEPLDASLQPVLEHSKLVGMCRANGLVILPQGTGPYEAGTETYGVRFDESESAAAFDFEPARNPESASR